MAETLWIKLLGKMQAGAFEAWVELLADYAL